MRARERLLAVAEVHHRRLGRRLGAGPGFRRQGGVSELPALTLRRHPLDRQEDGYLDLIGDPEWPKDKISQRLRQVRDERQRLQRQLANTDNPQINAGREAIEILLDLLNDPREIYRLASKRARKVLNRAFFVKIFVDMDAGGPYIATEECTEPVERLHTLETQTPAPSSRGLTNEHLVEVRGIEPRSITALPGLLRAQLAVSLLGPTDHASKSM